MKIAYIMSRFPQITETFILREMNALVRLGWEIELFPLVLQTEAVVHDEAQTWMTGARKVALRSVIHSNLRLLAAKPFFYFLLFLKVIWGNLPSPKFLLRSVYLYPRAVWMAEEMARMGVRHVHVHFATHPALAAWVIHQITAIPYSVTVHAHDIFVDKTMLAEKLSAARGIVAISEFNRNFLVDLLGVQIREKISVIHCGIEPEKYNNRVPKTDTRQFEILSIGSLQPYKGFSVLIDACALLRDRGVSFRCRVIGRGELQSELEEQVKARGLGAYFELLGPKKQGEVAELLSQADCYVQPSVITPTGKMEGIPVSIMEALASGLPVVATSLSGIPELVRHEQTGLLVEPSNPLALADALLRMKNDPLLARKLAESGRRLVLAEFDLAQNVAEISNLFHTFLNK